MIFHENGPYWDRARENAILAITVLVSGYLVVRITSAVNSIVFSPLKDIPGPFVCRISRIPFAYHLFFGTRHRWFYSLHLKYGPIVRYAPERLSLVEVDAWNDIYGNRKDGPVKNPAFYPLAPDGAVSMFAELDDEGHKAQRRLFNTAFSERALAEQEQVFQHHVGVLVSRIRKTIAKNAKEPLDMVKLLNFASFDIMGDLAFGETLGLLQRKEYTPYVLTVLRGFKLLSRLQAIMMFEPFKTIIGVLAKPAIGAAFADLSKFSEERVQKRMASKVERPDIWGQVLKNGEKGTTLTVPLMNANASVFMGAGSETSATAIMGLLYYLCRNPQAMYNLTDEIRKLFRSEADITMEKLARIPYLQACIQEILRIYPPVPTELARIVRSPQSTICGKRFPAGTHIMVPQYAMNRLHCRAPSSFLPERHLGNASQLRNEDEPKDQMSLRFADAEYAPPSSVCQPFSVGPRGCIGKSMAYHEMRLLTGHLLWAFDWSLCDGMDGWADGQAAYAVWEKPPLMLLATERHAESSG